MGNAARPGKRTGFFVIHPGGKGRVDALEEFRGALAKRLGRTRGWDKKLSAQWYGMAIKLDLEARGELKRSGTPQRLTRA